jgi:hypothetical protein
MNAKSFAITLTTAAGLALALPGSTGHAQEPAPGQDRGPLRGEVYQNPDGTVTIRNPRYIRAGEELPILAGAAGEYVADTAAASGICALLKRSKVLQAPPASLKGRFATVIDSKGNYVRQYDDSEDAVYVGVSFQFVDCR